MGRTIAITAATVLFGFAMAASPAHAVEDTDDLGSKSCPKGQQVQQQQRPLR